MEIAKAFLIKLDVLSSPKLTPYKTDKIPEDTSFSYFIYLFIYLFIFFLFLSFWKGEGNIRNHANIAVVAGLVWLVLSALLSCSQMPSSDVIIHVVLPVLEVIP